MFVYVVYMLSFACDDSDSGGRWTVRNYYGKKPNQLGQFILNVGHFSLCVSLSPSLSLFLHSIHFTGAARKINEQIYAFPIAMIVHFSYFHTYLIFCLSSSLYRSHRSLSLLLFRLSLIWKYRICNGIMIHFNRISFPRFASSTTTTTSSAAGERVFVIETIHFFLFMHVPFNSIRFIHILWQGILSFEIQLEPEPEPDPKLMHIENYSLWFWTALELVCLFVRSLARLFNFFYE